MTAQIGQSTTARFNDPHFRELIGNLHIRHGRAAPVVMVVTGVSGMALLPAVQSMARDMGRRIQPVDLSRLASKYIGETEKNIAIVFAQANAIGAVLFFDEADALFGKRTEVKDAHDRYTNTPIAHAARDAEALLRGLETMYGVAVVAGRSLRHEEIVLRKARKVRLHWPP